MEFYVEELEMDYNNVFYEQKKEIFKILVKLIIIVIFIVKSKILFYVFFFVKKSLYLQRSS